MYVGQIVELRDTESLFEAPAHPYTQALLRSIPRVAGSAQRKPLGGEVPSPARPPSGCRFHPRCPQAFERCPREMPQLYPVSSRGTGTQSATQKAALDAAAALPQGQSRCFLNE
jgi:oligopeptide/dipeptide ABC transporter ATP-binding protein